MASPVNFDSIPEEIKAIDNWVLWRLEERSGKYTKIPYQTNEKKADATNPDTWNIFDNAKQALIRRGNEFSGIGFVLSENTGIIGIDWDHVRDPKTGDWDKEAFEEIKSFGSYAEISQSGTGAHVLIKGLIPGEKRRKGNIEMYSKARFFVVTGQHIEGTPAEIQENQEAINKLYKKRFGYSEQKKTENKQQPEKEIKLSDPEIIGKLRRANNAEKFNRLYSGDTLGYTSKSEADCALCSLIAFYTKDKSQIDRIFRSSGLYRRDKWEREDYRDRTINKALHGLTETYSPYYQEMENNTYPYILTDKGVGKSQLIPDPQDPSKYETRLDYFLRTPVKITALSDNLDGEQIRYKIGIDHPVIGHIDLWKDQGELLTRSGVNKLLSEGIIGTDSAYKDITKYFMLDILKAADEAPTEFIADKTGWKRDNTIFVAGNEAYTAGGVTPVNLTDKEASESFTKKGTLKKWAKGCEWILQHNSTRINCYTVFSSIIAAVLQQPSPILQNVGFTGTGKTLKSSVGASMMGNPSILIKSADTTRTAAERGAIATDGMCSVLDELGLLKNPDGLTYLLSNGKKKQRGTKEGREEEGHWYKSFILNGEFEFLKESAAQGEIGRLIECSWQLPKNAIKAKSTEGVIRENYGHITPLFFEKLFPMLDGIKEHYEEICASLPSSSSVDIGSRLKDSFALITIAGEILEEVFEEIQIEKKDPYDICEKLYIENITSERVKPYWIRGLNIIYDEVNACKPEIGRDGEETGKFYYKGQMGGENSPVYIDIQPASFKDMCEKHGLKHTQLMQEWRDNGITEVDKPGKNGVRKSQKTVRDERGSLKVIRLIRTEVYNALELIEMTHRRR